MSLSYEQDDRPDESGLAPGTTIANRFRVDRKLGEGGMGAVYAALNITTNRPVALKVMHPEYAAKKDIVRRFMREAKAATAINHPNVIEVLDVVDSDGGEPVMVMELLQGEPLDGVLGKRGALALGDVARIMLPVVAAVGAAHARGIVHRDLKPENIYLAAGPNGSIVPKVLDFGIAKILDPAQINELSTKSGATRTGSMLGTPHYMSIEQACGERDIDHRTDIWSIGVILYVMLSGRRPYDGENYGQILKALMTQTPQSIADLVPGLPLDVVDLIGRCMRRARDERPIDLREVYSVLSRYCADTSVAAPPSVAGSLVQGDLVSGATLSAASMYTSQMPSTGATHAPGRSRSWVAVGAIALGALAVGAGLTVWKLSAASTVEPTPDPGIASATKTADPASSLPLVAPSDSAIVITPTAPASPDESAAPPDATGRNPKTKPPPSSTAASTATGKAPPAPTGTSTDGKSPKGGIIETLPY